MNGQEFKTIMEMAGADRLRDVFKGNQPNSMLLLTCFNRRNLYRHSYKALHPNKSLQPSG
jgi:hypothetical protein